MSFHTEISLFLLLNALIAVTARREDPNPCHKPILLTRLDGEISISESDLNSYRRQSGDKTKVKHCVYKIVTMQMNYLWLSFSKFSIEDEMPECLSNYVEILIGCADQNSIGRFCGKNLFLHDIYSIDHCITLVYHSEGSLSSTQGLKAEYSTEGRFGFSALEEAEVRSPHALQLNKESGEFSSQMWPVGYADGVVLHQRWVVQIPEGYAIKLSFMAFSLAVGESGTCSPNRSDLLQILAGFGKLPIKFCGHKPPFYLTYTGARTVNISFLTNGDGKADRGFIAGYIKYKYDSGEHSRDVCSNWLCAVIVVGLLSLAGITAVTLAVTKARKFKCQKTKKGNKQLNKMPPRRGSNMNDVNSSDHTVQRPRAILASQKGVSGKHEEQKLANGHLDGDVPPQSSSSGIMDMGEDRDVIQGSTLPDYGSPFAEPSGMPIGPLSVHNRTTWLDREMYFVHCPPTMRSLTISRKD